MTELQLHTWLVYGELAAAVATLVSLLLIVAPYGRHGRGGKVLLSKRGNIRFFKFIYY